jgi:hypothetical protein
VTNYHLLLQCVFYFRQLIFSEPEVIALPASGEGGIVYILMTNDYYKSGRLQLRLEKLNMTVSAVGGNSP